MKKEVYLTILYDYYSNLFNEKQREYFENYYFLNQTLSEISDNLSVSRNAIHKQIKMMEEKLEEYEKALNLYEKDLKLKEIISSVNDDILKMKLEELINEW